MTTTRFFYFLPLVLAGSPLVFAPKLLEVYPRQLLVFYGMLLLWMGISRHKILDRKFSDYESFEAFLQCLIPRKEFLKWIAVTWMYGSLCLMAEMTVVPWILGKEALTVDIAIIVLFVYAALVSIVFLIGYFTWYRPSLD